MAIGINKSIWEKIGIQAGWKKPSLIKNANSKIQSKINDFYKQSQDLNPNMANFAVDIRLNPISLSSLARKKINDGFKAIGAYHSNIPLKEIIEILKSANVLMIQEDGTIWEGFVFPTGECGKENSKPFKFDLAFKSENNAKYLPCESALVMSACTMPSGKIELLMYLS